MLVPLTSPPSRFQPLVSLRYIDSKPESKKRGLKDELIQLAGQENIHDTMMTS